MTRAPDDDPLPVVRASDLNVMAQIEDLVCKLDIPTPAVLLEVKILSIDLKDSCRAKGA